MGIVGGRQRYESKECGFHYTAEHKPKWKKKIVDKPSFVRFKRKGKRYSKAKVYD